jgi:hypothetical protein
MQRSQINQKSVTLDDFKGICAKALKLEVKDVDETSSFVAQGGDSILAIRLISLCWELGIELNTVDIIEASNITELWSKSSYHEWNTDPQNESF